ncbi:hypothetical protein [Streptomyces sp. NPDC048565]|uniref:hypothetical protein n=1 Tax=Streptomyces sp. NPDC048565 TaxID=3155266 RepID=UPI0034377F14
MSAVLMRGFLQSFEGPVQLTLCGGTLRTFPRGGLEPMGPVIGSAPPRAAREHRSAPFEPATGDQEEQ